MSKLLVIFVSLLMGLMTLSGCTNSLLGTSQLSDQVLQIIRDNPQVVIESVVAYQQQQEKKSKQDKLAFFQQMITEPDSIIGNSPITGAEESKIVLVEFSDFQCPFCAKVDEIVKDFMDKHQDEVTFTYKHFPLNSIHAQAQLASQSAWAAQQQGKFWEYHDALFENQDKLGKELYTKIAQDLNLNLEQFESDRQTNEAKIAINEDIKIAEILGLNGTPFFAFNGQPIDLPITVAKLEEILDQIKVKL
ncbi:DsbA family protein [Aphanothece sacrum]|uniref:DsbA oxidoreductase n=1 Tax=Aphanothece sacrum FPU1 TaxID=1920663 RepID=A0A401IGY5_APHSA|nr:thioredoxin domain-containing protein [Aphanothece sacrum]GBF80542.1 DsbA oxidoreductase [Aphanothece sacrum FPU1]